ncbi:MAG: DUF3783 domain-containing protein [Alkalispirochaetaceae bacterium]
MKHQPEDLTQRVIIMNGFSAEEMDTILKVVKKSVSDPQDVIFAMTTKTSVEMKLRDLIEDMTEDHEYLKKNPPSREQRQAVKKEAQKGSKGEEAPTE